MACCLFLGAPIWAVEEGGWGLPIVVNVLCSSGSKWLNHWTKKRKWNVPWVSQWLFFFLTIQKSRTLHPESPSLWPGIKHLKGWGHRGEDEVAALRGVDCYLPPLSEIHLCAGKQSSEKLMRWWFWVIVSLSFQNSNFKSQPLCGSRLSRLHEFHLQLWSVTARYQHLMNSVFVRERVGVCVCGQLQLTEKLIICILNELVRINTSLAAASRIVVVLWLSTDMAVTPDASTSLDEVVGGKYNCDTCRWHLQDTQYGHSKGVPMVISHLLVRYLLTLLFHSTTTCSSASYKWHILWSYCKFDIFLQLKESEPVRTSQGWPRSTPKWVCFFLNRGFLSFMMEARCPWDTGVLLYSAKSMVDHSTAGEMHILLSFIQNIVQKSCVSGFYTGTVNW